MRQVIIVSLNNNAFHFEDDAYSELRRYMRRAENGLGNNPDVKEILGDLERSIAEKCASIINTAKNVVNREDILRILNEVGPVTADLADEAADTDDVEPPRLFRRPRGATMYGVCAGIAAYFSVDVILVRILAVAMLLFNPFLTAIIYIVLRMVMPEAPASSIVATPKQNPALMVAAVVLVLLGVIGYGSHWTGWLGLNDLDVFPIFPMRFRPFSLIGMAYSLILLGVVIAAGIALIKIVSAKSNTTH